MEQKNIRVALSESAANYCRAAVEGHSAYGAPLQSRLQLQTSLTPFAFLPEDREERASSDFVAGGIADEKTDKTLTRLLGEWARSADRDQRGRLLVFEDTVAKRSDPSEPLRFDRYFEDWTYSVSPESPTDAELEQVVAGTVSYPAVGVVSTPSLRTCKAAEFDERNLDDIAGSAVALLVRAWDDEAFIVLPLTDDLSFGST